MKSVRISVEKHKVEKYLQIALGIIDCNAAVSAECVNPIISIAATAWKKNNVL